MFKDEMQPDAELHTAGRHPSRLAALIAIALLGSPLLLGAGGRGVADARAITAAARTATAHASATRDPLAAEPFYVRVGTAADRAQRSYQTYGDRRDAALMARITRRAAAIWLTGFSNDLRSLGYTVRAARRAHRLVTAVIYDIPGRDCGSYSSGGAGSAAAYRSWIEAVARRIGSTPSAVIVEPDALAEESCWSAAERVSNVGLIRYAGRTLSALPHTSVYLDAGNPDWKSPVVMAGRLRAAGVAGVRGFAVNTASFLGPARSTAYGDAISARLGGKHFVIDTSRDGRGALVVGGRVQWCNPPGRGLGPAPTARTGHPLVDAYLWIKVPGESDGPCNGGPTSGQFWAAYALGLAARASG